MVLYRYGPEAFRQPTMFATFQKEVSVLNMYNLTTHTEWNMLDDDWFFVTRFLNALDPNSPPETDPELPQDGEDSVPGTPPSDDGIAVGSSPADYYDYTSGSSQEQQGSQEWQQTVTEDEYSQEDELTEDENVYTASLLYPEHPRSDYSVSPSYSEELPMSEKSRPTQDSTHNTLPEPKGKGKQVDIQPDFEHKDNQVDSQPDMKGKGKHVDSLPDMKGKGKHVDSLPIPDIKGKGKHADCLPLPDIKGKDKHVDSQPDLKRKDKRVVAQAVKGKGKKVEVQVEYLGIRTSPRVSKEPHHRAARSLTPKRLQDPEVECQGVRKSPQANQEPSGKVAGSETADSSKDADIEYLGLRRSARLIKEPSQRVARSVAAEHLHRAEIKYLGARASPQVKKESPRSGSATTKHLGVRTSPQVKKESSRRATGSAAARNLKDAVKHAQGTKP